ncbi:pyridoxal phosphate-dependent aminotransferase [Bacteroidetes bacterium endosymbiont of Geopemphigus sp.]|uniref:pyridoxal phosphate-dependent aminotransferase n=1 Tax=Bacteroidetes bacterium endosymbiont of Geopemphigus sp. TaxID=2047937 RepID=UPI000CD12F15|nr:pyridoxal phosphate-dependent aminotransferase [Bacteroidetes bacterium endosymbiont of Geopemphigus sp.]
MPKISKKGVYLPSSPIRKLSSFADMTKKKGIKIYHLNIGQPDIPTPYHAIESLKNTSIETLAYGPSEGFENYRKKLVKYYEKCNIFLSPNDLIITTGASESLAFTMASIADTDDEIIIPEPFYANYKTFAQVYGIKIIPILSSIENHFMLPPISAFEEKISVNTKGILICNPNNPTGALYTERDLHALKGLVKKHDLFLISDEAYREFVYQDKQAPSLLSIADLDQHAIMIDSVSKRYSMCGARIGCIGSKNKVFMESVLKLAQARLCPPTLEQFAAEAALDTPDQYFESIRAEYKQRRDTLIEGLLKMKGVVCPQPEGAFYCMAEFPIEDTDHFARWLLEDFHHKKETVMVAPASGFYNHGALGKKQIRLAYVLKSQELKRATEILNSALESYLGNTFEL